MISLRILATNLANSNGTENLRGFLVSKLLSAINFYGLV